MLRQASAALGLVALVATLTACGMRQTVDPVAAAATKTEDAGGYKVSLTGTVTTGSTIVRMDATGQFDQAQGVMKMNMNVDTGGLSMAHGVELEARYLTEDGDPVIYVDLAHVAPLPSGKSWVRIDLQKAGKALGLDFSKLMGSNTQNPTQSLEMLRASGDFTEVGKETIGGVETTHYHGTVDLERAAAAKGIDKSQIQRLIDAGMATEVPVDVWVDKDGYVRQYTMTMKQETAGATTTSIMTLGMSNFGTDVNVTAPPSDQVLDVTGAAGAGSASGSKGNTA